MRTLLNHLGISPSTYLLECVGGKDNLHNASSFFKANTLQGGKNLIVFDADSAENGGGCVRRREELRATLASLDIEADIFLFPNDSLDGDFESILENIAMTERHKAFFDCFSDYEACLGDGYVHPNRKGKCFTYISAMPMSKTKRDRLGQGEWLFDNKEYWNLDSDFLNPLKDFLIAGLRP